MENIDTLEFGAEITVDGMPAWLRDDEHVMGKWGDWFDYPTNKSHYADPANITAIRLPADHWTYPVIAAGFVPWGGGDAAPWDWDGGEVLRRDNSIVDIGPTYKWDWYREGIGSDIIGYKRKVAPGSEMWSAATVYEPGDVVRIPNGGTAEAIEEIRAGDLARFETVEKLMDDLNGVVTIPTMTEEDARGKAVAYSDRWFADELKTVQDVIMAVYTDLGLIRPTSLLDQFEAHHGGLDDNQRAILEIYQEWVAGQ